MSVARDDGRVVGVAAHSLYRMALAGGQRPATFSVHATTDPVARGRGIFVGLERKHEEEAKARGAAVALAFASAPTAPLFLGPLGWTQIGKLAYLGPAAAAPGLAARAAPSRSNGSSSTPTPLPGGRTTSCATPSI